MKKIKLLLLSVSLLLINSCASDDSSVTNIIDNIDTGAVLRQIGNDVSAILNSSVPESEFSVNIEEQDEQNGELFKAINVYVTLNDRTPENGETVKEHIFVKTINASEFTAGPVGLPRGVVSATFGETATAMNVTMEEVLPGDVFVYDLELELTDGRTFSTDSGVSITGGFFKSPFRYNAILTCSPVPGDYLVVMHDSYGDGWQTDEGNGGSGIQVDIDGTIVEVGMCTPYGAGTPPVAGEGTGNDYPCTGWPTTIGNPTSEFTDAEAIVTIPDGTVQASWNFPGDWWAEISFEVYAPDGTLLYEGGPSTPSGILPILNCL